MPSDATSPGLADIDRRFMGMAITLARRGRTAPNPNVGAVIVKDGVVVGTGFHPFAGGPHAEVVAIRATSPQSLAGATLYVTLEPCNHHGRTPPCTDAVLAAGIARVVVGCVDPKMHGPTSGIPLLRERGVDVAVGIREAEAKRLIADFTKVATLGLPGVTLKAALTLDGRMATRIGDSRWITGERARVRAHELRDSHDAILVGVGTVLRDDPELTVRWIEGRDPRRVILDSRLRIPLDARVLATPGTIIVHGGMADADRRALLTEKGAELLEAPRTETGLDLRFVLRALAARNVLSVLVEGGPAVHGSFLVHQLADRVALFLAPRILGDDEALPFARGLRVDQIADGFSIAEPELQMLGSDFLIEGELRCSPA